MRLPPVREVLTQRRENIDDLAVLLPYVAAVRNVGRHHDDVARVHPVYLPVDHLVDIPFDHHHDLLGHVLMHGKVRSRRNRQEAHHGLFAGYEVAPRPRR